MRTRTCRIFTFAALALTCALSKASQPQSAVPAQAPAGGAVLTLQTKEFDMRLDGLFYETAAGRTFLPSFDQLSIISKKPWMREGTTRDGHVIRISVTPQSGRFNVAFSARPNNDIVRW